MSRCSARGIYFSLRKRSFAKEKLCPLSLPETKLVFHPPPPPPPALPPLLLPPSTTLRLFAPLHYPVSPPVYIHYSRWSLDPHSLILFPSHATISLTIKIRLIRQQTERKSDTLQAAGPRESSKLAIVINAQIRMTLE